MKKIWVYSITFYSVYDEYNITDWCGTYIEVFPSKESAEKFKKDWEDPKNLKSLEGTWFNGCDLHNWFYKYDSFESDISEKEILNY